MQRPKGLNPHAGEENSGEKVGRQGAGRASNDMYWQFFKEFEDERVQVMLL